MLGVGINLWRTSLTHGGVIAPDFPPNVSGTLATVAADFVNQQYYALGSARGSFAAWLTAIGGTYTRASSATYLQGGVVKTAAVNTPRFPTDAAGVPQGIRMTGASTNVILQSTNMVDPSWFLGTGLTRTTGALDPTGGNNAQTLTAIRDAAWGTTNEIFNTGAIPLGQQCTSSVWIRRRTGSGPVILSDANLETQPGNLPVTSTWQKFSIFTPATTASSAAFEIDVLTNGDQIDVWNAQITQTAFVTDDIPTTTSAVTQAADVFTAFLPPWLAPSPATWLTSNSVDSLDSAQDNFLDVNHNGTEESRFVVYVAKPPPTFTYIGRDVTIGNAVTAQFGLVSPDVKMKFAVGFADNNTAAVRDGGTPQVSTGVAGPSTWNRMYVMTDYVATPAWGHMQKLAYWPLRASNAELVRLST